MDWSFVKELRDPNAVREFAAGHGYSLPPCVRAFLETRNAGYPPQDEFDTDVNSGRQFKCLFTYNEEDPESIFKYWPAVERSKSDYPIGTDCCGNVVYYDIARDAYILIDHVTNRIENVIASSNPELFVLSE